MAIAQGWGKRFYQCKLKRARLSSWGHGFNRPGGPPADAHFTLETTRHNLTEQLQITFETAEEIEKILKMCKEFLDRQPNAAAQLRKQ